MHAVRSPRPDEAIASRTDDGNRRTRAAWIAGFAIAGISLFLCYLRLALTSGVSSDGASIALQASDMLHGNLLLHGWRVADVSFYTTELPQYMLIELVRGLSPGVIPIAGAMTYTLVVLLAAILAKGRATGSEAVVRMVVTTGILLAPQLGAGASILVHSPDHIGTAVPVLATWLLLDRAPQRWYVAVLVGLLLAWVQVADTLATYAAALPLLLVCGIRAYRELVSPGGLPGLRRDRLPWARYDLMLAAAAAISVELAKLIIALIRMHGGYVGAPLQAAIAADAKMSEQLWVTVESVLMLFGADIFGQPLGLSLLIAALHLIGVGLVGWAVARGMRRFFADGDLAAQVLVAGTVITLAAYLLAEPLSDASSTHEMAVVLPFGAVLAGRLLARSLLVSRALPALALVLAGYVLALGYAASPPPALPENAPLASWLAGHHLYDGLAGYWQANSTTLNSDGKIQLAPVIAYQGKLVAYTWEARQSWYDPRLHDASFLVTVLSPTSERTYAQPYEARATFGPPVHTYRFRRYVVLVWDKNLLTMLRMPAAAQGG
jgi:hypothetical protein